MSRDEVTKNIRKTMYGSGEALDVSYNGNGTFSSFPIIL